MTSFRRWPVQQNSLSKYVSLEKQFQFSKFLWAVILVFGPLFCQTHLCRGDEVWGIEWGVGVCFLSWSYYSRPWGFLHFLSVLLFAADSVHLFVGGELLLRTGFKRHIASDLWDSARGRSFSRSVGWSTLGPTKGRRGRWKNSIKKEWSRTCTLRR